jgi:hypothetical protein
MSVFQKRKSRLEGMSAMPTPDIYVGNGPSVTIDTAPSQGSLDEKICRFGSPAMPLLRQTFRKNHATVRIFLLTLSYRIFFLSRAEKPIIPPHLTSSEHNEDTLARAVTGCDFAPTVMASS